MTVSKVANFWEILLNLIKMQFFYTLNKIENFKVETFNSYENRISFYQKTNSL